MMQYESQRTCLRIVYDEFLYKNTQQLQRTYCCFNTLLIWDSRRFGDLYERVEYKHKVAYSKQVIKAATESLISKFTITFGQDSKAPNCEQDTPFRAQSINPQAH